MSHVLWDVMSCRVVQVYGHFQGSCSLVCHIPQDSNQHGHSGQDPEMSHVLWDVMSCRVVQVYGHFQGSCSLVCHIPQDSNQHGHSSKTLKCHTVSYPLE